MHDLYGIDLAHTFAGWGMFDLYDTALAHHVKTANRRSTVDTLDRDISRGIQALHLLRRIRLL